jgi:CDP-diglyceride synthetase
MFKHRLMTTLVLVPLVLCCLYLASPLLLLPIMLVVILMMGFEWLQLIPLVKQGSRIIFLVGILGLSLLSMQYLLPWLIVGFVLWGFITVIVVTYPRTLSWWDNPLIVSGVGLIVLPLLASVVMHLYQCGQGQDWLLYVLCLIWAVDIGAYLIGSRWGRHRLIPQVSPGKTIEGAFGGVVLAALVTVVGYFYFEPKCVTMWCLLSLVTVLCAMVGDLFISMLKRRSNIKDTGQILPGHGGVLDRLDSVIAALPPFYWGLIYLMHHGMLHGA